MNAERDAEVLQVLNSTRQLVLARHAELADTFWSRFRGLMGRECLAEGDGLVLRPGGAIHTLFMRFPLDVLHLDRQGRVTHVLRAVPPWRLGPLLVGGAQAIELPAGAAGPTAPGDLILLEAATDG